MPSDPVTLFMEHRGALLEYAARIVGSRSQAEDVVQEAWLRFSDASARRLIDEPLAYLYRIVRNLALDFRRRISADLRRDEAHLRLVTSLPAAPSPEEEVLQRDDMRRVNDALAELAPGVRRAFEMHRIGGYTLQEIAEHLGVSLPTAGRWAQEALMHVAKCLQRRDQ